MKKFRLYLTTAALTIIFTLGYIYLSNYYDTTTRLSKTERLFKRANAGEAKAQNTIGTYYETGQNVERNLDTAISWYKKAAAQDYALAQLNLAVIEYRNKRYESAYPWFEKAANLGNAEAQVFLGNIHENGNGLNIDHKKAMSSYEKAALNGHHTGEFNFARLLYKDKNYKEAIHWYKKASDQNMPEAHNNLASMYEKGLGVEKDLLTAGSLYKKAANQGITLTQQYLDDTLSYCRNLTSPSEDQVESCFIAAGAKQPDAQRKLSNFYAEGKGLQKNNAEAFAWLMTALSFEANKNHKTDLKLLAPLLKLDKLTANEQEETKKKTSEYIRLYGANIKKVQGE